MQAKSKIYYIIIVLSLMGFILMNSIQSVQASTSLVVKKSRFDQREYKYLVLKNNLHVLLVSDKDAKQATVAMTVKTGHLDNPKDRQGLAHFIEHMLFLGSKKYGPDSFMSFVGKNGGDTNAYTTFDNTTYFFSVQESVLAEALDRFADMFATPKLSAKFIAKELNAVSSEHEKNKQQDESRIFRVLQITANKQHAFHQFSTGNTASLYHKVANKKKDLQQAAKAFYEKHYKARAMYLVVSSDKPLKTLEKEVQAKFVAIRDGKLAKQEWKNTNFLSSKPRNVAIQPIGDRHSVSLLFPIPSQKKQYKNKMLDLILYVLGTEEKNSFIDQIRTKGWAISVNVGEFIDLEKQSAIALQLRLTKEGMKHTQEILDMFYGYIQLLKTKANWQMYFKEQKQLAIYNKDFGERQAGTGYVLMLSSAMRDVAPEDTVIHSYLYDTFDLKRIKNILAYIRPKNMNVYTITPHSKKELASFQSDIWYNVKYKVKNSHYTLDTSRAVYKESLKTLALPKKNEFIPSKLQVDTNPKLDKVPSLLKTGQQGQLWYRYNNKFKKPNNAVTIRISTPSISASAKNLVLSYLYKNIVTLSLQKEILSANIAGLNYSIGIQGDKGLLLELNGFSEKQPILLDKILYTLKTGIHSKEVKQLFIMSKNATKQDLKNSIFLPAYHQASISANYVTNKQEYSKKQLISTLDSLKLADLQAFFPHMLEKKHYTVLVEGSVSPVFAKKIYSELSKSLGKSSSRKVIPKTDRLLVSSGKTLQYVYKSEDANRSIFNLYLMKAPSMKDRAGVMVLNRMIAQPFFNQLRTKEQLGYVVQTLIRPYLNQVWVGFLIQSKKKPLYLKQRIQSFLTQYKATLPRKKKEFESVKKILVAILQHGLYKNLYSYVDEDWQEIALQRFDFNRRIELAKLIQNYSFADFQALFSKVLISKKARKQLVVNVYAKGDVVSKAIVSKGVKKADLLKQNIWQRETFSPLPSRK